MVIFTGGLLLVAGLQWWTLKSQSRWMEESGKKQLRTYVYPTAATLPKQTQADSGGHLKASIEIANTGKTPARQIVSEIRMSILDNPASEESFEKIVFPEPLGEGTALAAGQPMMLQPRMLLSLFTEHQADITFGDKAIYVYGEIRYIDAFEAPQHTKFRMMCYGIEGLNNGLFRHCKHGNDAT